MYRYNVFLMYVSIHMEKYIHVYYVKGVGVFKNKSIFK